MFRDRWSASQRAGRGFPLSAPHQPCEAPPAQGSTLMAGKQGLCCPPQESREHPQSHTRHVLGPRVLVRPPGSGSSGVCAHSLWDIPPSWTITHLFLETSCHPTEAVSGRGRRHKPRPTRPRSLCALSPACPSLTSGDSKPGRGASLSLAPAVEQLSSLGTRLWPECGPCVRALVNSLHNHPASY